MELYCYVVVVVVQGKAVKIFKDMAGQRMAL